MAHGSALAESVTAMERERERRGRCEREGDNVGFSRSLKKIKNK